MEEYEYRVMMLILTGITLISIGLLIGIHNITTVDSWFNLQLKEPVEVSVIKYISYAFGSIGIVLGILTFYVKDGKE